MLQRYAARIKPPTSARLVPHYDINRIFAGKQEQALTEYYKNCAPMFYGLTKKVYRKVAYATAVINKNKKSQSWIVNQMAGIDWLKRHK